MAENGEGQVAQVKRVSSQGLLSHEGKETSSRMIFINKLIEIYLYSSTAHGRFLPECLW